MVPSDSTNSQGGLLQYHFSNIRNVLEKFDECGPSAVEFLILATQHFSANLIFKEKS